VGAVDEPLRRLRHAAVGPAPAVGFERAPRRLLVALRAAAAEAAAGAATLALLEAAPRTCDGLLAELAERERTADMTAREVLAARSAIAGVERALGSSARAASALQRLSLS
jgi:hypothetical protein